MTHEEDLTLFVKSVEALESIEINSYFIALKTY